jgi:hypothetical protein
MASIDEGGKSPIGKWGIILSGIFLAVSWRISYLSGFSDWTIAAWGGSYILHWDPDGMYLGAGISLGDIPHIPSDGPHPGLPLIWLIYSLSRTFSLIAGPWTEAPTNSLFVAKNIFWIAFLSKCFITIIHLLSFFALYRLALVFTRPAEAKIAVLAYGTTMIVFHSINKISPEPFVVLFSLLGLLCCYEFIRDPHRPRGYLFLGLSALNGACAILSKFMISAPLFFFVPAYILSHPHVKPRLKWIASTLFIAFSLAFLFLLGWKIDWEEFFRFWIQYAPGGSRMAEGSWFHAWHRDWTPGLEFQYHQFFWGELPFLILSLWGLRSYWKFFPEKRRQLAWLLLLALLLTPAVLYRAAPHYGFLHFALGSIFFGYGVCRLARWASPKYLPAGKGRSFLLAAIFTLFIHSFGIGSFLLVREEDIGRYQKNWRPYFQALEQIRYGERIGMIKEECRLTPDRVITLQLPASAPLALAFQRLFQEIDPARPDRDDGASPEPKVILRCRRDGVAFLDRTSKDAFQHE